MPRVLTTASDLQEAEDLFKASARAIVHERVHTVIGYQGGTFETEVLWHPSLGIWSFFGVPPSGESEGKRFWNAFGVGRPEAMVSITCEVNPSREGINRRTKGAFVRTQNGHILACHRGAFNIHGGMAGEFFRANFRGERLNADEGGRVSSFAEVAELGSSGFGDSLRDFVLEVCRIKGLARGL